MEPPEKEERPLLPPIHGATAAPPPPASAPLRRPKSARTAPPAGAPKDDFIAAPDWKTLVPRPPDTEFRRNFQPQPHDPDLKNFTRKYGCNAKRTTPVKGAVPSVSFAQIWNYEHSKQLSTYQRDFGQDYLEMVSVLNSLDPEEIRAYVNRSPYPEKAILQNFLDKVNKTFPRPSSSSSSKKMEENPVKACDNCQEKTQPSSGQLNYG